MSGVTEVQEGEDGWLFLTGGSNQVLRFYTEPDFFTDADARAWAALLRSRADRLAGLRYRHLVVPDKLSVLAPAFGAPLPHFDRHPLAQMRSLAREYGLEDTLVDCTEALAVQPGPFRSYYKTDSHWTIWGAWLACRAFCRSIGYPSASPQPFGSRPLAEIPTTFDLGTKLHPPRQELLQFTPFAPGLRRSYTTPVVELRDEGERSGTPAPLHHGSHVVLTNDQPVLGALRLVVFGDSFADYRPSTLTALLAELFAETHFIWSTGLDYGYFDAVQPVVVLSEIAERFMTVLPVDDYQVEQAAAERVRAFHAARGEG